MGLAQVGLALIGEKEIKFAIESYRKVREIAPHRGVLTRELRYLDELKSLDKTNILSQVREVLAEDES